jgi:RNA polymerase sigma factor (sigma-70 family)
MEASALRAPAALTRSRPGGVLLRLRSDEQLVALFRQGNEDAFRVIHDRYRQRLSAYARQMLGGSATDADDAMQDVFLRAYAALRADDRPLTLRAWLYRVAHNRCIDQLRRPASQPTDELLEGTRALTATTGDPIVAAERREALRRLVVDVQALPEQQRSALLMREMEGLTYVELAAALDVTVPAVKSLLVRARMGLVESRQARDTPCDEIREDITSAHDRGVRASGRARRHARECAGCAGYRTTLRGISDELGALSGPGFWGMALKLIGLGAGGSGAAGGAAAAGGGAVGATTVGATGTLAVGAGTGAATKLAAVVCCAAVLGGGVEAARERVTVAPPPAQPTATRAAGQAAAPSALQTAGVLPARTLGALERVAAVRRAAAERAAVLDRKDRPTPAAAPSGPTSAAIVITAPEPDLDGTSGLGGPVEALPVDGGAEAPSEGQPVDEAPAEPTATDPASAGDPDEVLVDDGTTAAAGGSPATGGGTSAGGTTGDGGTRIGAQSAQTAPPAAATTAGTAPRP